MALNIPGVIAVALFYVLILGTGVWAAQKSKKAERKSHGGKTEVVLLGDRNINLLVGICTMTGKLFCGVEKLIQPRPVSRLCISYLLFCWQDMVGGALVAVTF